MSDQLAPVALFAYNRPTHTFKTIEALKKNTLAKHSHLIVFSDGPKYKGDQEKIGLIRSYLEKLNGFRSVKLVFRDSNYGLANSITEGVTDICNIYGRVIVLEDDLVTSRYFLKFMNDALKFYDGYEKVGSICGYWYPVDQTKILTDTFFTRGTFCWGWATWRDRWQLFELSGCKLMKLIHEKQLKHEFDFDGSMKFTRMLSRQIEGKNDSWAIRWYATMFVHDKLQLLPKVSFVRNIGFDGSGTHSNQTTEYDVALNDNPIEIFSNKIAENIFARTELINYFNLSNKSLVKKILNKLNFFINI